MYVCILSHAQIQAYEYILIHKVAQYLFITQYSVFKWRLSFFQMSHKGTVLGGQEIRDFCFA